MTQLVAEQTNASTDACQEEVAPIPWFDVPLVLRLPASLPMDEDQFFDFCQDNDPLRIERNAQGELIIMPPAGGETGNRNFRLVALFGQWVTQDGTGEGFDSSTGFTLPNSAHRSPDVAWVKRERLAALKPEQKARFLPLCPDFVIELRSPSDRLKPLQDKMQEYIDNGVRLGWLIDPSHHRAYIYRPDRPVEQQDDPVTLSGDPELPGFVLTVAEIFKRSY
jgi:Uma2 family endonuclease